MTIRIRILTAVLCSLALSACAANLCERKNNWLSARCAGTDVTWSPDTLCEQNLDRCNTGQLQMFEKYVQCLESQSACSLDVLGQCGQAYPGGVNLQCAAQ